MDLTQHRAYNFSAGPAALPTEVLQKAQQELLIYQDSGASIMELSHRGTHFDAVLESAKARLRLLLGLTPLHHILFLQGGATQQFCSIPMNFLTPNETASYINTGVWSQKAIKEAKLFGKLHIAYSSESTHFDRVPTDEELNIHPDSKYVHFTSNNTIYGTQFHTEPESNGIPLVCDASSDFLSRPIQLDKYGLLYAGAQKNLGPSGVAVVIIHDDFLKKAHTTGIPTFLQYGAHTGELYNTPPTFTIYLIDLVLEWLENKGGVTGISQINDKKADLIYRELDFDDFYSNTVQVTSRSKMNVLFRLQQESLEKLFLKEAETNGLIGLKAHRATGGIRASLYNAIGLDAVNILVSFMQEFRKKHG